MCFFWVNARFFPSRAEELGERIKIWLWVKITQGLHKVYKNTIYKVLPSIYNLINKGDKQ